MENEKTIEPAENCDFERNATVENLRELEDTAEIIDEIHEEIIEEGNKDKSDAQETEESNDQKSEDNYTAGGEQETTEPAKNTEPLNLEEQPVNIDINEIRPVIESLLFVAGNSVSFDKIQKIINIDIGLFRKKVQELNSIYKTNRHCFKIIEVANGFQIVTRSEYADWIRKFFGIRKIKHLPPSALETLSIIAYKQPVTKAKIENIRGVNSDAQLQQLLEKKMAQILGRAEELGRPIIYGTTNEFLEYFGLKDLKDLPDARELDKLISLKRDDEKKKVEKILTDRENQNNPQTQENTTEQTQAENNIEASNIQEDGAVIESTESEPNKSDNADTQNPSGEETFQSAAVAANQYENESSDDEPSDDELLDKEYIEILSKEKNIRKSTQEMFEKMNSPEEFRALMESRGFKLSETEDIKLDDEIEDNGN